MPLTEIDLRAIRDMAVQIHSPWKQEIALADMVASDKWDILWPDMTVESSDPLVENLYAEALEDKSMTAAVIPTQLFTPPTRGTRRDAGEKNASERKRVGLSYWERSDIERNRQRFYRDWLHAGIAAGNPWATGFSGPSVSLNPADRFAYFQPVNPRQLFPLGWDNRGRLTAGLVMRQKRLADLYSDWGAEHPVLKAAELRHALASRQLKWLEEIWYFDGTQWAVAISDANLPETMQGMPYAPAEAAGSMILEWLVPPHNHGMQGCPLKASARVTHNDVPRGALVDIIPQLKLAQNFMARLLDDLEATIYAPVVLDNIKNAHEYGLGAVLVGTGQGRAQLDRDRPPVNFEAQQTVRDIMEQVRRQAMEPQQRSGEPGAAIVSGKGTTSLMGTFNAELAIAQHDIEILLTDLTSATANFDAVHCAGSKQVWGVDDRARAFDETYDPDTLFKGDFRFRVTYGDRTGLDDQQHLTRIATIKNLGGMSLRRFMEKAGITEDPLEEETEMAIERLVALYTDVVLTQQIQAGDLVALQKFVDKIDSDKMTVREAVYESIKELTSLAPADGAGGPAGPAGGPRGRADILRMVRSLGQGGIPGNAEGQPGTGPPVAGAALRDALNPETRRAIAQVAPGGTAT